MNSEEHNQFLEELLSRIALGDRLAFKTLYDKTAANLFGGALRILKERSLAEDALQDTFVQIWKNAVDYREGSSEPMTWLHSIARYRAIDMLRKRRNETANVPIESHAEHRDPALHYFEKLERNHHAGLIRCLSLLDEKQRNAIVMCYCEGYSHSELSNNLSIPLGTVKSWIRRGLQLLRECLEK